MRPNSKLEKKQFKNMSKIEPRLTKLRAKAVLLLQQDGEIIEIEQEECDDSPETSISSFWDKYETIKGELNQYVGWHCPADYPEFMKTEESHDIAYREVFYGLV